MKVRRFDRDTFTMDGQVIHLSKHTYQEILGRFLEGKKSSRLEPEVFIGVQIVDDLTHESLKRNFPNQQFGRLLIPSDLTQSDSARTVPPRFSDISTGLSSTFAVPSQFTRGHLDPNHGCRGPLCVLSGFYFQGNRKVWSSPRNVCVTPGV